MSKHGYAPTALKQVSRITVIALCVIAVGALQSGAQAQSTAPSAPPQVGAAPASVQGDSSARLIRLEQQVDDFKSILKSELDASNMRFEAATTATNYVFTALIGLGAIGSLFAGAVILFSWLRTSRLDERHESDYKKEREFYETQVLRVEHRQELAAARENALGGHQLTLAENVVARSAEMLSQQLDGIGKLAGVIDLVDKTFAKRNDREDEVGELLRKFENQGQNLASIMAYFRGQYDDVLKLILPFAKLSRMSWTRLQTQDEVTIRRGLAAYQGIPPFTKQGILDEDSGKNRFEFAQINYLLGVGAFYTNDIGAAGTYLERAVEIFGLAEVPPTYRRPQAFCNHFSGVLQKNWRPENVDLDTNLQLATRRLRDADNLMKSASGEFLTPVTLAEVLSYSEQTRKEAETKLEELVKRFEDRKKNAELDGNQHALLGRAYLLCGNIEFLKGDQQAAGKWYQSAYETTENVFALLSSAQSMGKASERVASFKQGLELLETGGALTKRETSSRVVALAWGAIAAREIGDHQKQGHYDRLLLDVAEDVRPTAGLVPVFFCPICKTLVEFGALRAKASRLDARPAEDAPANDVSAESISMPAQ